MKVTGCWTWNPLRARHTNTFEATYLINAQAMGLCASASRVKECLAAQYSRTITDGKVPVQKTTDGLSLLWQSCQAKLGHRHTDFDRLFTSLHFPRLFTGPRGSRPDIPGVLTIPGVYSWPGSHISVSLMRICGSSVGRN